jgi:CheY-like chemotaxis protein
LRNDDLVKFGKLTTSTLIEGRYAMLEVTDNGIGMSPETINSIFDPFFTTKFTGRGLGLSAVLGIIHGHEGGIMIESTLGLGTTFRVILPSTIGPDVIPMVKAEELTSVDPAMTTILVIDDEHAVATMAQDILESGKYPVLVELNPLQGIEVYRKRQSEIGLVLLDLTMPEMSGKDVVNALIEINPHVKIIISSGYSETEVHKNIDMDLVAGFIQKPYPMKMLLSLVHSVM